MFFCSHFLTISSQSKEQEQKLSAEAPGEQAALAHGSSQRDWLAQSETKMSMFTSKLVVRAERFG